MSLCNSRFGTHYSLLRASYSRLFIYSAFTNWPRMRNQLINIATSIIIICRALNMMNYIVVLVDFIEMNHINTD